MLTEKEKMITTDHATEDINFKFKNLRFENHTSSMVFEANNIQIDGKTLNDCEEKDACGLLTIKKLLFVLLKFF